ncbi:MAG TPA: winged helix-turn-helix transcriptional regulator [Tepidimicrobium sp.]|nr:winged helix-turn-helix transcriptional regulator [Tepidimicrobium sp.]
MIEKDVAMQLKGTYQKIRQIMQLRIDKYGLPLGLLFLMSLIEKNPKASQKELAEKMRFTEGAMSNAVRRLMELGMLKQVPLELDMRYNRLILTDRGKSVVQAHKNHLFSVYRDIFSGLKQDELERLYDILLKINENLDNINS